MSNDDQFEEQIRRTLARKAESVRIEIDPRALA